VSDDARRPLSYAAPEKPAVWRRLPTILALAGLITVVVLYVALWAIALHGDHVRAITRHYDTPAGFRGNHGPWRHHRVLRGISGHASVIMVFGVLPLAGVGALVERTRRGGIVAVFAVVMLVVDCAHFPLFD
jgi:hypothetical protein